MARTKRNNLLLGFSPSFRATLSRDVATKQNSHKWQIPHLFRNRKVQFRSRIPIWAAFGFSLALTAHFIDGGNAVSRLSSAAFSFDVAAILVMAALEVVLPSQLAELRELSCFLLGAKNILRTMEAEDPLDPEEEEEREGGGGEDGGIDREEVGGDGGEEGEEEEKGEEETPGEEVEQDDVWGDRIH
jgi:hypothetical protein